MSVSDEKAKKAIEAIFERYRVIAASQNFSGFDFHLMHNIRIVSATSAGSATFEFLIDEKYANLNGVMHGGAAGVIFDMCTTSALGPVSKPGFWDFLGGVTRTLNISYLKGIPVGTKVRIHSEVMQFGRTMAMIRGEMTSLDGSVIYCTCEHHKVNVPTKKEHMDHKVDWDRSWDGDTWIDSKSKL